MKYTIFGGILGALALWFSACAPATVSFTYLQPAAINLPSSVQHIVVVDHSAPKDSRWDILEGGLTGEAIGQDREAIINLIGGIREIGAQSNRFTLTKEGQRYGKGKLLENIPDPMSLTLIKSIAKKHRADAVLSIDKFDSDFITTNARIKDKKDPEDTTKRIAQYQVTGVATVKTYIRVYEAKSGEILDEIKFTDDFTWSAKGTSIAKAMMQLMNKQKAINEVGYRTGLAYGRRIAPTEVAVTRQLYKRPKGDNNFDRAVRKAEVADWYGAIRDFEMVLVGSSEQKMKAKAAYNLAVCHEVLGELEKAEGRAQDAYVKYGLPKGRDYQSILQHRIEIRNLLIQQMERPAK